MKLLIMTKPRISLIITAYNRHDLTTVHVKESMEATLLPDEIIVVNDHGDPCLKDMLKKLELKTKLIYAYITDDIPWNYTGARNLAACISTGDFIISEDNDNIPAHNLYGIMFEHLQAHPETDLVLGWGRPVVAVEDMIKYPITEWEAHAKRKAPPHNDSFMIRREVYWKLKGYDEQFAGRYAWVCTDWNRRLVRGGFNTSRVKAQYFTAVGDGTNVCECGKTKAERAKSISCPDCGLLFKRMSYKNYGLARGKTHIQPPGGILNFTYTIEEL